MAFIVWEYREVKISDSEHDTRFSSLIETCTVLLAIVYWANHEIDQRVTISIFIFTVKIKSQTYSTGWSAHANKNWNMQRLNPIPNLFSIEIVGCSFTQKIVWPSHLDVNLSMCIDNRLLVGSESIKEVQVIHSSVYSCLN